MILRLLCPLALSVGMNAAVLTNVPCDWISISNAVTTAGEGDILTIAPGSCVWSNNIKLTAAKSFWIRGSGTNQTTITSAAGLFACLWISNSSTNTFKVSDLNLVGVTGNNSGWILAQRSALPTGLIHIWNINMTNLVARGIDADNLTVIDNCTFVSRGGSVNSFISTGYGFTSWATANPIGTLNNCFVEDCVSDLTGGSGNGHFDNYAGAQIVIRYNKFVGSAPNGNHGYDSQPTSCRSMEIYSNIFTNIGGTPALLDLRGGVILFASNIVYAPNVVVSNIQPLLRYYRGCYGSVSTITDWTNVPLTNRFSGTASSATSTTLTDSTIANVVNNFYAGKNLTIAITGGTGSGQTRTISASTPTSFTVSVAWDTTPDNTSTYEIRPVNGSIWRVGNQPNYIWKSTIQFSRDVKLGSDLAESLSNLVSCVALDPAGAGTRYTAGSLRNDDFLVKTFSSTDIIFTNILDGFALHGWPAAMQPGVISVPEYTNNPVITYPCYSWNNTVNGTNVNFGRYFETDACNGMNEITNLLVHGRDYFNDTATPRYTPVVYPHPVRWNDSVSLAPATFNSGGRR